LPSLSSFLLSSLLLRRPPTPPLFPYTTLFRSHHQPPPPHQHQNFMAHHHHHHIQAPGSYGSMLNSDLGHASVSRGFAMFGGTDGDRKSTRLNSSHVKISYAVFCLKKKKKKRTR